MKTDKKIVTVVAAVICDDMKSPKKIFATQRGYGEFKGGWEFPGGKIEQGETSQEALEREIIEELATKIKVGELIDTVEMFFVWGSIWKSWVKRTWGSEMASKRTTLWSGLAASRCEFDWESW